MGSGGGDLGVARGAREEVERGGGGGGGGGMRKARVCVRAPHGAGALLVVGGAVVGAAVFAWCRRRGEGERKRGAKNHGEHPAYVFFSSLVFFRSGVILIWMDGRR